MKYQNKKLLCLIIILIIIVISIFYLYKYNKDNFTTFTAIIQDIGFGNSFDFYFQ